MKRAMAVAMVSVAVGCFQLTGVSDFKVEEACTITPGSPCRVAPNCGCEGAQTCELAGVNGEGACKPAGGTARGGGCSANADCAKGLLCLDNVCTGYCRNDNDCSDKICEALALGTTPVNGVGFCGFACDPGNPVCADGRACRFVKNERALCSSAGPGTAGASCTTDAQCAPGFYCDEPVCVALCRVGEPCDTGDCRELGITYKGTAYGLCPRPGGG
jgi:hypothetical protein